MVPSAFVSLAALPLTPNGKVDRNALPAPELPSPEEGHVAPRTPVEEILADIWSELLGVERVGATDDFFNLGGHSLLAVLLMARIEKRMGKTLPLAALFSAPTLESLASLLAQTGSHTPGRRRSPLVAIKPKGTRVPFFCVHPVSGNVLCYLELANRLAPEQPFFALQTPDLAEGSATPSLPSSIEDMAALYVEELRRIQPQGPYLLGGWSMGGLIAFEMACILAREGDQPDLVALIDTLPPAQTAELLRPIPEEELMVSFVTDLARALGHEAGISPEDLRPLTTTQERLSHVVKLGRAAGLVTEDIGLPQIASLFETFSINFRASRLYNPGPYPGHLVLWYSEQTLSMASPGLFAAWNRLAQGVETSVLAGDHYTLLLQPQAERLAHELTARIGLAQAATNDGGHR
jgi:thioesterase domain-containing protein/acyl carrier protein